MIEIKPRGNAAAYPSIRRLMGLGATVGRHIAGKREIA